MSMPPQYDPSIPYASLPPQPPGLPTGAKVIGILAIIFGGLGLLCMPFSLIAIFSGRSMTGAKDPMVEMYVANEGLRLYSIVMSLVGIAMSALELFAGIGILK